MFSVVYKVYKSSGLSNITGSLLINGSLWHSQSVPHRLHCVNPYVYFPQHKLRKIVPGCNILSRDKISSSIQVLRNTKTKKFT